MRSLRVFSLFCLLQDWLIATAADSEVSATCLERDGISCARWERAKDVISQEAELYSDTRTLTVALGTLLELYI